MRMVDIIENKKNNKKLTHEEIDFFVQGYTKNEIPDYQMSSLLMAICINGMDLEEATNLTKSMINSGDTIDLSSIKGIKLDKHSTGGVGDKVSLVLGPIVASCGGIITKMSGRGLGHTGGTLDKLESISGFNCSYNKKEFISLVKKSNISIVGQTDDLVPADKKIYALRDASGTVNSMPLIASSIMSKKIATGSDVILLDIKCGSGAFMKNIEEATELGNWMLSIGKKMKKNVKIEITNMEQPLGRMIGNKNEVLEAIESLKGNGEENFMKLIYSSASLLLIQGKLAKNEEEAKKMIDEVITNGKALEKFKELIENQEGNFNETLEKKWWNPKFTLDIKANEDGFVYLKNSINLGMIAVKLGAGRVKKEDGIDFEAGIEIKKVTNEKVKKGDVIMTLYSSSKIDPSLAKEAKESIDINKKTKKIDTILKSMK